VVTSYGASDVMSTNEALDDNACGWVAKVLEAAELENSMFCRVRPGTTDSSTYDIICIVVGYKTHTHTTPAHTHDTPDHTHPAHDHTVTIAAHTHTTPNHQHVLPDHAHTLDYGIYESSTPATVRVYLDGSVITALNDLTIVNDFDLKPYIAKDSNGRPQEGWHTLEFKSATAGATGSVRGTVFTSKFLNTEAA